MGSTNYVRHYGVVSISTFILLSMTLIQSINAQADIFPFCVTSCEGRQDGQYANCFSCSIFVFCANGAIYNSPCFGKLKYDATKGMCNYENLVTCKSLDAISQQSSTSISSQTSQSSQSSTTSISSPSSKSSDSSTSSQSSDSSPSSKSSASSESSKSPQSSQSSDSSPSSQTTLSSQSSQSSKSSQSSRSSDSSPSSKSSESSESSEPSVSSETSESSATSEPIICVLTCSGTPAGDWPACDSCQDFFRCDGSDGGSRKSCSSTLEFDPDRKQCALDSEVNCVVTSPTSLPSDNSDTSEPSQSSSASEVSKTSERSVTSEQSQTSDTIFCTTSCTGLPMGVWADCNDCASFYRCIMTEEKRTCNYPLLFNPDTGQCDMASMVTCGTTSGSSQSSQSSPQSLTSDRSQTSETSQTSQTSLQSLSSEASETSEKSDTSPSSPISDSPSSKTSASSQSSETSEAIICVTSCVNVPFGDFPDCDNCQVFHRCNGDDTGEERSCSSGLLFNANTMQCDVAANAVCSTTSASSQSSPSSETSDTSERSDTSETSQQSLTSRSSQSSESSATSEVVFCLSGDCGNHGGGLYPDCDDCEYYHMCKGDGTPGQRKGCGNVLLAFDPVSLQCGLASTTVCATTSASSESSQTSQRSDQSQTSIMSSLSSESSEASLSSERSVTSESSPSSLTSLTSDQSQTSPTSQVSQTSEMIICLQYSSTICSDYNLVITDIPSCEECEDFIRCDASSNSELKSCQTGLLFNPSTQMCDLAANVADCATTSATSMTSQTSVTSETSLTSDQSMTSELSQTSDTSQTSEAIFCVTSCVNNVPLGDWPDCDNCKNFYRCDGNNGGSSQSCPSVLLFNPSTYDCDLSDNVVCATTSASSASSEPSPSPSSATSDRSMTSQTSITSLTSESIFCTTSCDNLPFGRFADCDDCSQFYECSTPSTLKSCGGLFFNPLTTACDFAANVVCATTSASSQSSEPSETSVTSMTPSLQSEQSDTSETSASSVTSESSVTSDPIVCLSSTSQCSTAPIGDYSYCSSMNQFIRCTGSSGTNISCGSLSFDGEKCV